MNTSTYDETSVENKRCKLLSWMNTGIVVAKGSILSTDPLSMVHHKYLEPDCWKLWVTDVVVENFQLYRPELDIELCVLDDAIGTNIPWPKKYICIID